MNENLVTRIQKILENTVFFSSSVAIRLDAVLLAHEIENGADVLTVMLNHLHDEHNSH